MHKLTTPQDLLNISQTLWPATILFTAVELDIFPLLAENKLEAKEIALSLKLSPRGTRMLLNSLVSLGLLEKQNNSYNLTSLAKETLVPGADKDLTGYLKHTARFLHTCASLRDKLQETTGPQLSPPEQEAKERDTFIRAMQTLERFNAPLITENIDLSGCKQLIDIAGGPAGYSLAFCEKYPALQATVFDLPPVVKMVEKWLFRHPLRERLRFIPGDLLNDAIPGHYDVALMSHIIHSFPPESNRAILRKVFNILNNHGKIIIHDFFLDDNETSPPWSVCFGLHMFINTEAGQTYPVGQVKQWLNELQFKNIILKELSPDSPARIIMAEKKLLV